MAVASVLSDDCPEPGNLNCLSSYTATNYNKINCVNCLEGILSGAYTMTTRHDGWQEKLFLLLVGLSRLLRFLDEVRF